MTRDAVPRPFCHRDKEDFMRLRDFLGHEYLIDYLLAGLALAALAAIVYLVVAG